MEVVLQVNSHRMINKIFYSHWDLFRWLRLIAGTVLLTAAFFTKDGLTAMLGGFFLLQAVMNLSCCGATGCSTAAPSDKALNKETEFEEVK
jgi:hypothetical protein